MKAGWNVVPQILSASMDDAHTVDAVAGGARRIWARARRSVHGFSEIAVAREALVRAAGSDPARRAPPAAKPNADVEAGEARADNASELAVLLERRLAQLATSSGLSPREREVLQLLLLGRNCAEIGMALRITPRTARFHQHNILEKIGAESRLDIVRLLL
jgi:DNA-binding CsgD family transcriptional regulator